MSKCILTPEQFAFMQLHHELVEYAVFALNHGERTALDAFIASEDYQIRLGHMMWDDVYDRYEDTPGYDSSLRLSLLWQFQQHVKAGRLILSKGSWKYKANPDISVEEDTEDFEDFLKNHPYLRE